MVGVPGAYNYGPKRCSWLTHHLTNWMGDDRILRRASCKIRRHNPEEDTLFIEGAVARSFVEDGRHPCEGRGHGRFGDAGAAGAERRTRSAAPCLPSAGERGGLVKLLWYDGQGMCLFSKRLERGHFVWPMTEAGRVSLTPAQLSMLLEGIDWRMPLRVRRPELAG